MKTKLTLLLLLVCTLPVFSQDVIELKNPSFENPSMDTRVNKPLCCKSPRDWYSCGQADLNTPDAQPGNFGVTLKAIDGSHHLGMVARDNDTWEAISSKLHSNFVVNQEYFFSLALAKSDKLKSDSRRTGKPAKYDKPIKVRIWGGDKYCKKSELLGETKAISNTEWEYFEFTFKPSKSHQFLTIECYYVTPVLAPYNGNILLDDLSPIIPITRENHTQLVKMKHERKAKILALNSVQSLEKIQTDNLAKRRNYNEETLQSQPSPKREGSSKISKDDKELISKNQKIAFRVETIKENSKNEAKGPVLWKAAFKNISNYKYQILWDATITEGWKLYSQYNKPFKGAMGVHINLELEDHFILEGKSMESENFEIIYDNFYNTDLRSFKKEASFNQVIEVFDISKPILGTINYAMSHEDGTINTKVINFVILIEQEDIFFEK